jgi:ring-1,2-phenylacetyl-CoA epoxidase subunit PaaC
MQVQISDIIKDSNNIQICQVPPLEIIEQSEKYERSSMEAFILHLADNNLILTQRNGDWCGHGPILEQDIAITNITLDLIGQSRNFYQYAAQLINQSTNEPNKTTATEDSLAYLRTEREFKNCLLVEQPNGDWAQTILRQFFYSSFQYLLYEQLQNSNDTNLAAIAAKSIKEVKYHVTWSSEWVVRLGDGTTESKSRLEKAINELWRYAGEMFVPADYEIALQKEGIAVDVAALKEPWEQKVKAVFEEATLAYPENIFMQTGGKTGTHTEYLGYLLTDMQYLQRTYPGAKW